MPEPIARAVVIPYSAHHEEEVEMLAKEVVSILRALNTEAHEADAVPPESDCVVLLVDEASLPERLELPDLRDRAAAAVGVAEASSEGRVNLVRARKHLRASGAALGPLELMLSPQDFGHLGLESDSRRERLEILLRTLVHDAERLRLKREGWEEPVE